MPPDGPDLRQPRPPEQAEPPEQIERRHPIVVLDVGGATALLERGGLPLEIRSLDLLAGGHVNTNYQVTARTGERYVLRIWTRGEDIFRQEINTLIRASGIVPVPKLRASAYTPEVFPYPYALLDWVTGEGLTAALAMDPEGAVAIGEAVAETLDRLGAIEPPDSVEPPFREFIQACLFEHGAAARLGEPLATKLWQVVGEHARLVDECAGPPRFVHGDFQGDNLLLRRDAGRWTIAAVLDWEWARRGSILSDLGSLLRIEGLSAFTRGVEDEFARRGNALPERWRIAAKLKDVAAQCEKLSFPRHRGAVTERAIRITARYLAELATPSQTA